MRFGIWGIGVSQMGVVLLTLGAWGGQAGCLSYNRLISRLLGGVFLGVRGVLERLVVGVPQLLFPPRVWVRELPLELVVAGRCGGLRHGRYCGGW